MVVLGPETVGLDGTHYCVDVWTEVDIAASYVDVALYLTRVCHGRPSRGLVLSPNVPGSFVVLP